MVRMISVELIDGSIDLLPDVASQALIGQRWQTLDALLFEAGAQLGLTAAFLAIALVPSGQLAMKGAITFAGRGGQEVCDADIDPDHRRLISRYLFDLRVHRERQPPAGGFACQRHAGVD